MASSETDDAGVVARPGGLPGRGQPRLPAEDRFARVVETSPTALVLTAATGRIELVNRQVERMFGYDRVELLGKPLALLMPESFRSRHLGLRKDGTEFPLEIGLDPIDIDGEPMVLASIVDITARRALEREQEQQRLELVRSNADLEEFAYLASHDLKAPLRAISHLAQWIGEDIEPTANPETLENLRLLQGRVARLEALLDGLLAYSRVGGHSDTPVEAVDIAEVVREVIALLAPAPEFVVTCEGTMPVIRTHRMPIQVVLRNLIDNALKHHDRAEGRITVATRLLDGVAEFRVTDDGPGIEPRFHERIFVIFQTLATRDDNASTGIGLAIVKKKIERNGGRIWVESAPPARGTSFVFTWKVAVA